MNSIETVRHAVAALAEDARLRGGARTRMRVIDNLHDPNDRWIRMEEGPFKTTVAPGDTYERYVKLTLEVEDVEDDRDPLLIKAHLRICLDHLRYWMPDR